MVLPESDSQVLWGTPRLLLWQPCSFHIQRNLSQNAYVFVLSHNQLLVEVANRKQATKVGVGATREWFTSALGTPGASENFRGG